MHCASSTATASYKMGSGICIVHPPLPLLATKWAVGDAWCIFHCHCGRQHLQWKMHGASSTATACDNMGNGRCVVHRPLPLWATTWAVEDALCSFYCRCLRQHGLWKMHDASSTATAGDNMCNGRCMVHLPLPLRATKRGSGRCSVHLPPQLWVTTFAIEDARCTVHCNCGRQHGQLGMHCASSIATAGDNICIGCPPYTHRVPIDYISNVLSKTI